MLAFRPKTNKRKSTIFTEKTKDLKENCNCNAKTYRHTKEYCTFSAGAAVPSLWAPRTAGREMEETRT